jgi:outer membrane protein assembly factor BamE
MHAFSPRLFLLLPFLFFPLSGCTYLPALPYKIDIQQGNVVTEEMVKKLKPGMTRSQVRFALGTPLVTDIFHNNRWDYIYRFAPSGRITEEQRLTVFFEDDRLTQIKGNFPLPPAFSESLMIIPASDKAFGTITDDDDETEGKPGSSSRTVDFLKENQTNFYKGNQ